jgi:hypothetical protein
MNVTEMFCQPNAGHIGKRVTWDWLCSPGSEHFQFVRYPPHGCVFLVVRGDKVFGVEGIQDRGVLAFLQTEKSAGKSFSFGFGHPCEPRTRNRHRV